MILSTGRSYIFVHIPKTGGTSLALALEARAMRDDILIGDTPKAKRRHRRLSGLNAKGRLWKHSTLADIDGLLNPSDLGRMFVFTLVRNPWDRLVSYYHWLRTQCFDHQAVGLAKAMDFKSFVSQRFVSDSFRRAPASSYVTDAAGLERCNLYIRLEHFEQDAEPLFEHLGFRVSLPRENTSERDSDYRAYYDTASRHFVADYCAADIARFGYQF